MFYTSLERMAMLYDRFGQKCAFHADNLLEYNEWKTDTKQALIDCIGLEWCEMPEAFNPRMVETEAFGAYTRETWTIETEPGIIMPFYYYKRGVSKEPVPTIVVPHGHGGGKEWALPPAYITMMLDKGYNLVCPDQRGCGERREFPEQKEGMERANSHRELNQMALGFGMTTLGLSIWDLMRLVDYLTTLRHVDSDRIMCMGMSGGGQQALWLTALDDRIAAGATSGYFYGMKEALLMLPQNCSCNFVPNIWKVADMGDIGALIAPRPFLIESGEKDPLAGANLLNNVMPQVETTRKAYKLLGAEDKLLHVIHDGGHEWRGKEIPEFFAEHGR
ncbi:MAG: alpha/beta fold hydrolase [Lachnospiraceae bacterium]|nr:alpha/beta fold hydrolase [Lachnospiraceae bacterium]